MIRLVIYLLVLAAVAFGVAWLADRPGDISIVWQGWEVHTSVMVAASALLVVIALAILLWNLLRFLLQSPDLMTMAWRNRRRNKGFAAISRGLVAVGSGDVAGARRAASDAERLVGHEPLARLLSAQAAQLSGNAEAAEAAFRSMAETPATRVLGLRGLHVEARRRGDAVAALATAEEAARHEPGLIWASDAVIEARCLAGDYKGALAVLEREVAHGALDRTTHRRRRAVLLAAQAQGLEFSDPAVAKDRAVEAVRLAPTLVPAAEIAGRLLGAAGDVRKASKILEHAYAATPHPELGDAYLHLRPSDSARERMRRVHNLTARAPTHPESAMIIARAALDAQEFAVARAALEDMLDTASQRVCLLMAELEATESGDIGKAREWTARAVRAPRDPAWVADGIVAERWAPVSPVTGRLDAFEWRVPPGVPSTPVLENEAERVRIAIAAAVEQREAEEARAIEERIVEERAAEARIVEAKIVEARTASEVPTIIVPEPEVVATPVEAKAAPVPPPAAPIPLRPVLATPHMPDDPGPDVALDEVGDPRGSRPPFGV
ncbi:heme biosynthesis protein HemY [Ancylobacter sp. 6x-1]|uniref:Heme biosynthesis protein HemY n=1 Tax=Ancylobacter crimeensis TaxID=2579147 RepID=A0ABT0DES9_9HYPH|nr:heme biosynthesis HemY N-terminal domain-containing protein [Ancylobacter crimeensis]MCK0198477.1 heme biosynthesis protein HemY [Ancylobacter crimeensis]